MNFKKLNESFEKMYQPLEESFNYTEGCIKRLEEALNEAEISDEDKHDSDLIRSMLDKMTNRANAKFSPEEIAILDKYGIKRDNNTRNLIVNGRDLYRQGVDNNSSSSWYSSKGYNNGTRSKINFADRARKLSQRKDTQIFTGPWTVDNDQINTHGGNNTSFHGLQDAERYSQDIEMRDKLRDMRSALNDRKWAQERINKADDERAKRMAKAQADFEAAKRNADQNYEFDTVYSQQSKDNAQNRIDKMLKRKPVEESIGGKWTEKAFAIINELDSTTELKDMLKKLLKDMSDKDVGEFLHQRGYIEYEN